MKKSIALLLVVVMAMSAVVTVAAEGTQQETSSTIEAPTYIGAQVKEEVNDLTGEPATNPTYSVRFVSTVKSTKGKCIGYEITATFKENNMVVYDGDIDENDEKDKSTEGTKIYSSIRSGDDTLTADDLEKGAVGIYVMAITGVPKEEHVIFNVTAYIKYDEGGEEKILKSTAKYERYAGGEVMPLVSAYEQDFNTATTLDEANFKHMYATIAEGDEPLKITGDALTFDITSSKAWDYSRWQIVPSGTFKYVPAVYAIEMDLTFEKLNVFNMYINSDSVVGTWKYTDRINSLLPTMRFSKDGWSFDTTNNIAASTADIWIGTQYFDSSTNKEVLIGKDDYNSGMVQAVDLPETREDGAKANFKYTIIVDSSYTGGCKIDYYIDNEYIASCVYANDAYDVTADSSIVLWAEKSKGSIDNLKVSVLAQETIYSQNFDTATTAANAAVAKIYGKTENATVLDGMLNIPDTGWSSGVFWQLVPDGTFANTPQKYLVEMDIKDLSKLGPLTFMFNGTRTTAAGETVVAADRGYGVAATIRLAKSTAMDAPIKPSEGDVSIKNAYTNGYDICARVGYVDSTGGCKFNPTDNVVAYNFKADTETVDLKLGILVDSSTTSGTSIAVCINGEKVLEKQVATTDSYDVAANSSIVMWAENSVFKIDNLTVSQLYK